MNGKLGPFRLIPLPKTAEVVGVTVHVNLPPGVKPGGHRTDRDRYENDEYIVFVDKYAQTMTKGLKVWELSILRHDGQPARDWRDLQEIKTTLVGAEYEAMEMFPAESRVIDVANETHLFAVMTDKLEPVTFHVGRTGRREVNCLLQRGQRPL